MKIDVHLDPADLATRARGRRPRRAHRRRRRRCRRSGSTTTAAASCSTRSPGCRSTTRPAPSARSWSPTPPTSPALTKADTLVELGSGTSEKTRLLLDAFRRRRTAATVRALRRQRATLRDAAALDRRRVRRASTCTRSSATSSATWRLSRRRHPRSSRSSAARSATSRPSRAPTFLADLAPSLGPATRSCSAPIW